MVGTPIAHLPLKPDIVIAAIVRGREVIFPRGGDTIEVGDSVIIVSRVTGMKDITDALAPKK
jgi:trk system potassium uptake protein TrkA